MLVSLLLALQITAVPGRPQACPTVHPAVPLPVTHQVKVNQTCERIFLDGPNNVSPGDERPLLVLFHGFAVPAGAPAGTHDEHDGTPIWNNHDLIQKAKARGWFVMMHDGGNVGWLNDFFATYGADRFQKATRKGIEFVVNNYPVDADRIYGYGFSMGGGELLSYSARNVDPTRPMFAASVVHSTYHIIYQTLERGNNSGAGAEMTYAFPGTTGIPYCSNRFEWRRANVLDIDESFVDFTNCCSSAQVGSCFLGTPTSNEVAFLHSQLHNISYQPYSSYYTTVETAPANVPWLATMNDIVNDWRLFWYPSGDTLTTPVSCGVACGTGTTSCPGAGHNWSAVCADDALDFFDDGLLPPRRLGDWWDLVHAGSASVNRTLLAVDGDRYFYFRAQRTDPNDFGRLVWRVFPPSHASTPNRVQITGPVAPATMNITTLTIEAGNDPYTVLDAAVAQNLWIETPNAIDLQIVGYSSAPVQVWQETPTGDVAWPSTYAGGVLSFTTAAGANTWRIQRF